MNATTAKAAIDKGVRNLLSRQEPDGAWRGEYGGPMFLVPMYVAACHVAGVGIPEPRRVGIIRYICSVQNSDGSIGLHSEGPGCMFTTVLCYVALRILDVGRDEPAAARMRRWVLGNGTALGAASWGKFMLAVLNLYPYEGLHPLTPELWLLPYAAPFHPGRLWSHSRQVYLPMAYLYGLRARTPENDLTLALRSEIYDRPYEQIVFAEHRDTVAQCDNLQPATALLRLANRATGIYERLHSRTLRRRALDEAFEHVAFEDSVTGYIDIGPVNSVLNALVHHFRNPGGEAVRRSFEGIEAYVCNGPDGVMLNGYNSTAVWDTAFAAQALLAARGNGRHGDAVTRAAGFLLENQIPADVPGGPRHYRHAQKGGWSFGNRDNGWPTSDCTAEGLKTAIELESIAADRIPESRLHDAVRLILSFQNGDGGWATYEKTRGGRWLELLNPSQVFSDIMIEHSCVECTSSCVQALVKARTRFPGRFDREVERAVRAGARFMKSVQRADGSWEGSWGVCFTYGTWFGVRGLLAAGLPKNAPEVRRAAGFLILNQNPDGGWGEDFRNCLQRRWIPRLPSKVVQTSWALMTLAHAGLADTAQARRAARFLVERQDTGGGWPRETMAGVFNRTVLINYDNYRHYFPLWALALASVAQSPEAT